MQKAFENRKEGIQCARKAQEDTSFIAFLFFSAPLIRTMGKVRHELWRLFWQYRHCCSDMWQTKQEDHPHGDLTEVIIGPENGQLAVKEVHMCGGEKVRWTNQIFPYFPKQEFPGYLLNWNDRASDYKNASWPPSSPPLGAERGLAVSSLPWLVPGLTVLLPLFLSVAVKSTEKLLCNES